MKADEVTPPLSDRPTSGRRPTSASSGYNEERLHVAGGDRVQSAGSNSSSSSRDSRVSSKVNSDLSGRILVLVILWE